MLKRYRITAYARVSIDVAAFDEEQAFMLAQDLALIEYDIDKIIEIEEVEEVDYDN